MQQARSNSARGVQREDLAPTGRSRGSNHSKHEWSAEGSDYALNQSLDEKARKGAHSQLNFEKNKVTMGADRQSVEDFLADIGEP